MEFPLKRNSDIKLYVANYLIIIFVRANLIKFYALDNLNQLNKKLNVSILQLTVVFVMMRAGPTVNSAVITFSSEVPHG